MLHTASTAALLRHLSESISHFQRPRTQPCKEGKILPSFLKVKPQNAILHPGNRAAQVNKTNHPGESGLRGQIYCQAHPIF